MANNISGNPVYIDSVGVLFTQRFKFDGGTWNGAAAGDLLTFVDNTGRFVFKATFPTSLDPVQIPKMGWVNGLTCIVIGSGNVTIFVATK